MNTKPLQGYRMLLVHAHPDDETINNGVTMAMYASLGAEITLITCTRGEEGEVLVPGLIHLASTESDSLGEHRVAELDAAMKELGVTDHRYLGSEVVRFRDSGMMGTPQNDRSDVFWQADVDSAAKLLLEVIYETRPHILVTYDEFGGYGHPDHIQAHRVAMRAAEISEKWDIQKIYWNAIPKSVIAKGIAELKKTGSNFFGAESVDDIPFAKEDALINAAIDGSEFVDRKMAAMKAHETQIALDGPFFALSESLGTQMWGHEFYTLVKGIPAAPFDTQGRETNLFAGIKLD